MEVKISRIHPDAIIPEYQSAGAACFDLAIVDNYQVPAKEIVDLPTGLVFALPAGHVLIIQPRSSSPKLGYHLPHGVGILDSDYCGPDDQLFIRVRNFTDVPIILKKHQRIAQGYIIPIPRITFKEVSPTKLTAKNRGGFGSTGHN